MGVPSFPQRGEEGLTSLLAGPSNWVSRKQDGSAWDLSSHSQTVRFALRSAFYIPGHPMLVEERDKRRTNDRVGEPFGVMFGEL